MATASAITIAAELCSAFDALQELLVAQAALPHRHGDRFRQLERDIERVLDDSAAGRALLTTADLEPGRFMVIPGPAVTELLREARQLGVLA